MDYIRKGVLNSHLGSSPDPCCIQNRVITNRVEKMFRCTTKDRNLKFAVFERELNVSISLQCIIQPIHCRSTQYRPTFHNLYVIHVHTVFRFS